MKLRMMGVVALSAAVVTGAALPSRAQQARTIYIWTGGVSASTLGAWGNGSATPDGDGAVTVRTRNFYEGARFDLNPPIDLAPYAQVGYLRLRLRFPTAGPSGGGFPNGVFPNGMGGPGMPFPGAMPGMTGRVSNNIKPRSGLVDARNLVVETRRQPQFGTTPPPILGPGGFPGGFPGGAFPGNTNIPPGMMPGQMPPAMASSPIRQLQLIVMRERGAMIGRIDVRPDSLDAQGGLTYAIALKNMRSTPDAAGRARRIVLTGDQEGTFFVDQFALAVETNRIMASIRRVQDAPGTQLEEIEVRPGPITLVADVESGNADASVEWNFDADTSGSLPPPTPDVAAPGTIPNMGLPAAIPPGMVPPGMAPNANVPTPATPAAVVGPRIDARGITGRFEYPNEEQNYRVEITVRDRANRKAPVKSSIVVKVRSG